MILSPTPRERIDWDSTGARFYHVPFFSDKTWSKVHVPLYIQNSGQPGPTVVAFGGTHGDEYEGPVGLKNLVNSLKPNELVSGRLIVVPVLNVPAFKNDSRDSPLDGGNMNRAFPGDPAGMMTWRIANFVTEELLPRADIVIDLHAGGTGWEIARCMSFHQVDDPGTFAKFKETALLFGTPFVLVYASGMGTGLLTEQAEAMGKITIGSELGYGASTDYDGVRWAHHGTRNVLRHYGLLDEPVVSNVPAWVDRQRVISQTNIEHYVTAPVGGISEPVAPVGAFVRAGDLVTSIHDFDRIDEAPVNVHADLDGYVMCRKFRARTAQGEVVMVIAPEVE